MAEDIHIAVTRRVRREHTEEFERRLSDFASRSLAVPGSRGVHLLFPPPGSELPEYGILRSFASEPHRDAFYSSPLYLEWIAEVDHLSEGPPVMRKLDGLEAWFRDPKGHLPPRWKMAVLTWIAVWPVSMGVPAALAPFYPEGTPYWLRAGVGAAGIVLVLTWAAMPLLVRAAHGWLHPQPTSQPHA